MKRILTFLIVLVFCLLTSANAWYVKDKWEMELPEHPALSYVKITTHGSAIGLGVEAKTVDQEFVVNWHKVETTYLLRGVGTVLPGGYVLTAAHVVHPRTVGVIIGCTQYVDRPIKILTKTISITSYVGLERLDAAIPAEIVYLDEIYDVALLKYSGTRSLIPVKYPIGGSFVEDAGLNNYARLSALNAGDTIAMVVRKRDEESMWSDDFEVRYGRIESARPEGEYAGMYSWNDVESRMRIYKGDSGSPVFAYDDKDGIKLVGVMVSGPPADLMDEGFSDVGYFARIDFVKNFMNVK